jgi:hypothetical protein
MGITPIDTTRPNGQPPFIGQWIRCAEALVSKNKMGKPLGGGDKLTAVPARRTAYGYSRLFEAGAM